MSCVYWAPKSRIRIREWDEAAINQGARDEPRSSFASTKSLDAVIRSFLDDLHVVHVRLANARRGDLHELGPRAEVVDGRTAAIPHCRAQSTHQLMDDGGQCALVRDAPFDALREEPLRSALAFDILKVAVGASLLHRAQRSHPAVTL